jgi:hypothetical protein
VRILFVTAYPPPFSARTRAATEHVRALRHAGHDVEVLSPTPTAAAHHLPLHSWRSLAPLVRLVRPVDRVVVADDLGDAAPLHAALRLAASVETWHIPVEPPVRPAATTPASWPSDRNAAMDQIRSRAAASRAGGGELSAGLRRVPPLTLPAAASGRPGAGTAKRAVRRLTAWEVDPVVARVNVLRAAMIEALEDLERRDDR